MRTVFFLVSLIAALTIAATAAEERRYTKNQLEARFTHMEAPEYPYWARRSGITGRGVFRIYVDEQGKVTDAKALKSVGNHMLDREVIKAFMLWRAKPGVRLEIDMPITFTMKYVTGVPYVAPDPSAHVTVREFRH